MVRRRQSLFGDVIEIAAMLPWWAGVVLAIVSYLLLHQLASVELVYPSNGRGAGDLVGKQIYKTLAFYLQFVIPLLFLIGAAVSAAKRGKRNALHLDVADAGRRALETMTWREFEQLVGEHFRRQGFVVDETGGGGADGGVDLVLSRGKDRYFVQCKQWKARRVGVETVRELYGVMAAKGAAGGYVVTSGVFTDEARRFAEGREIELIDGEQLTAMIRETPPSAEGARKAEPSQMASSVAPNLGGVPDCPQCGSTMVLRTARKGSNAGSSFWGCSTFPRCKGTRAA